ncbi:MAG TPA: hypothetical protein VHM28_03020 [Anaerolineales bacterium]|jgi:hypothetical protein|nr:hypothetical protein [Anaerolineales bacterium]
MLKRQDVTVGKCFVNERTQIAREVIAEIGRDKVRYNAFDLRTGNLAPEPVQVCFKGQIAYWADREAMPEEIQILHPFDPTAWFENTPMDEAKQAELEFTKARMLQTVEQNTAHRC